MYKYVFGPVPSRRLGMSLGIDLVPRKVCSLDCVYCEVGKTTRLTVERKEYFNTQKIMAELERYFAENPDPDYITFSGSGEPTLHSNLKNKMDFVQHSRPQIPVAILTNGTLFHEKSVRESLLNANLVLPSLDAGTEEVFQKINRPHKSLTIGQYIEGLVAFREEFHGKIWLEVFILPGYNDNPEELSEMKKAIVRINPDSVQLNTLDRPGLVQELTAASREDLERIREFFEMDNVEIIAASPQRKNSDSYRKDVESAMYETILRRPCTLEDLSKILGLHRNEINKYLTILEKENKIVTVRQSRGIFYKIK